MSTQVKRRSGLNNGARKALTPGRTIRAYCLHCVGGNPQDVKACDATDPKYHVCPFHSYRLGRGRPSVKVIRNFCLDCMGGHKDFVRDCETTDCLCHPYRMGKNAAHSFRPGKSGEWMQFIHPRKGKMTSKKDGKFQRSGMVQG